MDSLADVSYDEFEAELTGPNLMTLQVLHAAMAAGNLVFAGIVAFLAYGGIVQPMTDVPHAALMVQVLTTAHVVATFVLATLGRKLAAARFAPEALARAAEKTFRDPRGQAIEAPAAKCLAVIRQALLLRLFLLDGAAVLGLGTCLIAVVLGVMREQPEYWLNVFSSALLLGYVLLRFPTADRLKTLFVERIVAARPVGQ